jgi:hypothetical protein
MALTANVRRWNPMRYAKNVRRKQPWSGRWFNRKGYPAVRDQVDLLARLHGLVFAASHSSIFFIRA